MPAVSKSSIPSDPWMSLLAASKALGESRLAVLTRAIAGEFKAKNVGGRTVVRRADIERAVKAKAK